MITSQPSIIEAIDEFKYLVNHPNNIGWEVIYPGCKQCKRTPIVYNPNTKQFRFADGYAVYTLFKEEASLNLWEQITKDAHDDWLEIAKIIRELQNNV